MIIQLNVVQITLLIFTWLVGITLALLLYITILGSIVTVIQGVRWLLKEDGKDV